MGVERGLDHGIDPLAQTLVAPVPRAGRGIALRERLAGVLVIEDELKAPELLIEPSPVAVEDIAVPVVFRPDFSAEIRYLVPQPRLVLVADRHDSHRVLPSANASSGDDRSSPRSLAATSVQVRRRKGVRAWASARGRGLRLSNAVVAAGVAPARQPTRTRPRTRWDARPHARPAGHASHGPRGQAGQRARPDLAPPEAPGRRTERSAWRDVARAWTCPLPADRLGGSARHRCHELRERRSSI